VSKSLYNKKAVFSSPEKQILWMKKVSAKVSVLEMANLCGCSTRTIRSWKAAESKMPYSKLVILANAALICIPRVSLIDRYAHTSQAGLLGSAALLKKYGRIPIDEKVRRQNWQKWFDTGGKESISKHFTKNITVPDKSEALAEFVGIMLGDGGLGQFQVTVTLHSVDDLAYGVYVAKLIQKLYGVKPRSYFRKDVHAYSVILARKLAVQHLVGIGLKIGNKVKQGTGVPSWILNNKKYSKACVRGLMDTDGSVYFHKYKVNGKEYNYKKLCFSSASAPLRENMKFMLCRLGFSATSSGTNVRIDTLVDVASYMKVVGTSNPKHLKRYAK